MAKHPVTGMDLEDGHGALHPDQQALLHLQHIELTRGHEVADEMRKHMGIPTAAEKAAQAAAEADTISHHHDRLEAHGERLIALEANAAEHAALSERIAELEKQVEILLPAWLPKVSPHGS